MDLNKFLEDAIKRKTPNTKLAKPVKDARFQRAVYTGQDQEYILSRYRTKESKTQVEQRNRITNTRTKHTARQIENVIDQLEVMDKPSIKVINEKEEIARGVTDFIYDECLGQLAFDFVKYYNLTDANAFVVCGVNEYEEIEYRVLEVNNVYDYKTLNKKLKFVVFKSERKIEKNIVYDYSLYHHKGVLLYEDVRGKERPEGSNVVQVDKDRFYTTSTETQMMYAFRLGFKEDMTNNQETTVALGDSASELWTSLIWQGSELDVIDATHGIVKQFAYARRCTYRNKTAQGETSCNQGKLMLNGALTGNKCPNNCVGGLVTHTSNQDIILYEMPKGDADLKDLSKLIHTEFIPDNMLSYKKEYIKEIKEEIIKTMFNSSMVTKDEINKTATKVMADLTGIYATLNQIGNQVTQCFIWMARCASFIKYGVDSDIIHGYTLSLKLDDMFSLADKLKALQESNAPIVLQDAIKMAMVEKQNMASPVFVARYSIWESLKPFSDKNKDEVQQLLSRLPDVFRDKVFYNFFSRIRSKIDSNPNSDKDFYEATQEKRMTLIDNEIDLIINEIKEVTPDHSRVSMEDFE